MTESDYYSDLSVRLRDKTSRDNHALYCEAADAIDELHYQVCKEREKYNQLLQSMMREIK